MSQLYSKHFPIALILGILEAALGGNRADSADLTIVKRWLSTNSGVASIQVNFTQTRAMRTLKLPIREKGTLWLDYRNSRFRWQTGNPPSTIVIRQGKTLLIVRPSSGKYERRPIGSGGGPSRGMTSLAGGFPRSLGEFQRKYCVLETKADRDTHRIETRPLGSGSRGVERFTFIIDSKDFRLRGMEIQLEDRSSIKTSFSQIQANVSLPRGLFTPDLSEFEETTF